MKHRPKKPADPTTPKRPKSPRPRRRTTRAERTAPPADAPYWLVAGDLWNHLPPAMCQAVVEILTPAYQRLVRDASDELERSAGITLIHLLWLEISEQLNMASVVADRDSILAVINDPDTLIAQHLRLVTAKRHVGVDPRAADGTGNDPTRPAARPAVGPAAAAMRWMPSIALTPALIRKEQRGALRIP